MEGGEIVAPIKDLRFNDSLYAFLGENLEAVTDFQAFALPLRFECYSIKSQEKVTGIVSAVSTASWAWFTNKRIPNYRS